MMKFILSKAKLCGLGSMLFLTPDQPYEFNVTISICQMVEKFVSYFCSYLRAVF